MTYFQIFSEIYKKKKKFIVAYVTFCLLFSILAFGNGNSAFATESFTNAEILTTLGGSGGKMLAPLTAAQSCLSGIDASTTLMLLCATSFALDYIPESALETFGSALDIDGLSSLSTYSFGIMDFSVFRIFCVLWFVVGKLSKSNGISQDVAKILGDFESLLTVIVNVMVIGSQFLANVPLGSTAYAASFDIENLEVITSGFNSLICFLAMMSLTIIYLVIRFFFYFIDILFIPLCTFVPMTSFGIEFLKTVTVSGLFLIAIFNPVLFYGILAVIFVISIIFFKKAYITIRYFKRIYIKPFFRRIIGYSKNMPLVKPNYPKQINHYVNVEDLQLVIPVYMLKKAKNIKPIRLHERWWLVSTTDKQFLCKPKLFSKSCYCIDLHNSQRNKIFIKKSLRFFEVFNIQGLEMDMVKTFYKVPKHIHFAISKEYYHYFDKIKEITSYTDYTEYRKELKMAFKSSRLENRMAKKVAAEERMMNKLKR